MLLSVLISVYAKEKVSFLDQCLDSVYAQQSVKPDEIIIVEDGPLPAELAACLDRYQMIIGSVLKRVKLATNQGLGAALNAGLSQCEGQYVARVDTDDICLPERFERQLALLNSKPETDLVGCFATEIDEHGNLGRCRSMPITHEDIVASLWSNPFIHPGVMFKQEKMQAIGGYDSRLRRRQDYELWFRCAKQGFGFANIPESLILYRFNRASHKKQTVRLAYEQALIGYRGARLMQMAWWKRLACFVPFFRSLLPLQMQHGLYVILNRFDPRNNIKGQ